MGPMVRGEKLNRRRLTKLGVVGLIAMFTWSLIAAPSSEGQDEAGVEEPEALASYYTFADALPVGSYIDHQVLPAPAFGPALAHSTTEVALPSEASSIAWLLDGGLANGLHGTTTGAAVPTEVSAKQPGGEEKSEYSTAGGPVGEEEFGRVAAGVARATAVHSDTPRGFANAYFQDVCLFPAAGSPPEPPGSYDPDATFPGGDNQAPKPDPGPIARQCVVSAASVSSVSQSIREGESVTSIAVAEVEGITIGDRTSDNRCTNCFYIDALRVEALAQANGQPGGSRAGYRLMFGRACRRKFVPDTLTTVEDAARKEAQQPPVEEPARELDQCLGDPSREGFPEGNADAGGDALHTLPVAQLNDFFGTPLAIPCPGAPDPKNPGCVIAIRINAGERNTDPTRAEHTSNPPEDVCRNYSYPAQDKREKVDPDCKKLGVKTGPDQDKGQEAKAVAEGIDIDVLTLTASQFIPPNADLESCFDTRLPDDVKKQAFYGLLQEEVGCPVAGLHSIRELNVTFGVAQAGAVARPNIVIPPIEGGEGGLGGIVPPVNVPPIAGGGGVVGGGGGGGGVQVVGGGGLGSGKYGLKIDWKSLKIKPWPAKDVAKAVLTGAIIGGMVLLIRRRLRQA